MSPVLLKGRICLDARAARYGHGRQQMGVAIRVRAVRTLLKDTGFFILI
jgi:hypothetical protein